MSKDYLKNEKDKCVSLRLTGKSLSIKRTYKRNNVFDNNIDNYYNRIVLSRRKIVRMILSKINSINYPKPNLFFSIVFPLEYIKSYDVGRRLDVFIRFRRKIKYEFPNSWFLYKYEWGKNIGLHMHMISYISPENSNCNNVDIIKQRFDRIFSQVAGFFDVKSVKVTRFKDADTGYLTKPDKRKLDYKCIRLIDEYYKNKKRTKKSGIINQNNITYHKPISIKLNDDEYEYFCRNFSTYNIVDEDALVSASNQLRKINGMISSVDRDRFMELINKIER